jgi:hypothetical protein
MSHHFHHNHTHDTRRQRKKGAIREAMEMLEHVLSHDLSPIHITFPVYLDGVVVEYLIDDSIFLLGSKISTYLDIFKNRILSHYHHSHFHPCPHHDVERFFRTWFDWCERCFVVSCNCCEWFEISLDKFLKKEIMPSFVGSIWGPRQF